MDELRYPYKQQRSMTPVLLIIAFTVNILSFTLLLEQEGGNFAMALQQWGLFNQGLAVLLASLSLHSLWLAIEDIRNPKYLILDAMRIAIVEPKRGAKPVEIPYEEILRVLKVGLPGLQTIVVLHRQGSLNIPIKRLPHRNAFNQVFSRLHICADRRVASQ